MIKEKIYNSIALTGMKVLSFFFPEYFASEPVRITDRFIEYNFVSRNLPKQGTILDVGCVGSSYPLILAGLGYDVTGVDIRSYDLFPINNFKFRQTDILNFYGKFNVILLISTLEHIGIGGRHGENEDLTKHIAVVNKLKDMLNPNGVILVTLPYGQEVKIKRPFHRIYDKPLLAYLFPNAEREYYRQSKLGWVKTNDEYGELCCLKWEDKC